MLTKITLNDGTQETAILIDKRWLHIPTEERFVFFEEFDPTGDLSKYDQTFSWNESTYIAICSISYEVVKQLYEYMQRSNN